MQIEIDAAKIEVVAFSQSREIGSLYMVTMGREMYRSNLNKELQDCANACTTLNKSATTEREESEGADFKTGEFNVTESFRVSR